MINVMLQEITVTIPSNKISRHKSKQMNQNIVWILK